jgi:hypothetical protein
MYFSAVLFLVIGVGSLVVAVVPGADEWVAETFLDSVSPDTDNETAASIIGEDSSGAVQTTSLILAATFIPGAFLFFWMGRWFKSMQPSFDNMMQTSAQMARTSSAMYQQYGQAPTGAVPGTGVITNVGGGVITGAPPTPSFNDPSTLPPPPG